MTNTAPDVPVAPGSSSSRPGLVVATGFGLGYVPWAPGTAGSLASVALFAVLHYCLEGTVFHFAYLVVLVWLVPLALWSTEHALARWTLPDPSPIVIDEILGQWLAYAGVVLATLIGLPTGGPAAGWKSLLAGFILFRTFDVVKPFPIRRSERLPGASGVLLDDVLAGVYSALGLLLLAGRGWLR